MSYVFYAFGIVFGAMGALWTYAIFSQAGGHETYEVLSKLIAAAPGIGTFLTGVLFLGIGPALDYLASIARNTHETSRLLHEQFRGDR